MQNICVYRIDIQGQVTEMELNATSPLQIEFEQIDVDSTQLIVKTDQSGLIGLMRYLHGLGFIFLSLIREK